MRILFVSSEVAPFSKTGGLGDVSGALPRALAALGHHVRVVTPLYKNVSKAELQLYGSPVAVEFPFGAVEARSFRARHDADLVFVDVPEMFGRDQLYGYPDDDRRFATFAAAALSFCQRDGFVPDVVHGNDWQTALVLHLAKHHAGYASLASARRVMTIHNLAFQGLFPKTEVDALGIPWDLFVPHGVEFFDQLSFMKVALRAAHVVTTVSPSYAQEIQTEAFGAGLEDVLQKLNVHGILNGVDTQAWNPATDVFLSEPFTATELTGRERCRNDLLTSCGLNAPAPGMPVFGVISRMVEQKGADLIQAVLPRLLALGSVAVVLGSGDERIQSMWQSLAAQFPERLFVRLGFDEGLAHRIEAGTDFFLMPSRFEPCGLNQMYSLLYGAVPVVHAVGGLKDTVTDMQWPQGNGVVFDEPTAAALSDALLRAVDLFRDPVRYRQVQSRGMASDFGWARAAAEYASRYLMNGSS
jgi:starch synthase